MNFALSNLLNIPRVFVSVAGMEVSPPPVETAPGTVSVPKTGSRVVESFPVPPAPVTSAHAQLSRWVGLSGRDESGQQVLADLSFDVVEQFKACEQRFGVLRSDYVPRFKTEKQRHEWQRLAERLDFNRRELERSGRFPSRDERRHCDCEYPVDSECQG